MDKTLNILEAAIIGKFSSLSHSVAASPVPGSPDYFLAIVRGLKKVDVFFPDHYVCLGRVIEWCSNQGVLSQEVAHSLNTF